jgi:hypothetical protein
MMFAPRENQRIRGDQRFPPDTISAEEFVRIEDLFRQDMFSIDSANVVREDGKLKALLRVSWRVQNSDSNSMFQEQSRTLAYFDRPKMPTPAFTLVPSSGAQGFLQGMISGISGLGIDFPDFPEFGSRFSVMTFFPRSTRALLNEKLRKSLLERVGVTVQTGTDGRIAIYQSGLFLTQFEHQEFLKVAEELAECIFESAALLMADNRPNGKEVIEAYQSMGMLGPSKDLLVTGEDVSQLLSQSIPREIPNKLLKKAYGESSGLMAIGIIFAVVGLIFLPQISDKLSALLFSVFTLVGLSLAYFAMRYRKSRKRLLRDGTCESYEVRDVQASNTYEKSTRLYFVTADGGAGTIHLKVHREAATMARIRKVRGEPINVLVDPVDTSKVLWLEEWAIDACVDADISR